MHGGWWEAWLGGVAGVTSQGVKRLVRHVGEHEWMETRRQTNYADARTN